MICGGGRLPGDIAAKVEAGGRPVVMFAIEGWADPAVVAPFRHHWLSLARYGTFLRLMRQEGCRDLVVIGILLRPSLWQLRPDLGTVRVLPRIVRAFRGGDDHLLTSLGRMLEDDGCRLLGAHEVAPDILAAAGPIGARMPGARDAADIALGLGLLAATSPFDVGQAAVVANRHVLAVEAAEGTDRMLARIAELREIGRIKLPRGVGVLVKAPKVGQDQRFDMPTVGPNTIDGVARAGLAGLAVAAGGVIVAEPQEVVRRADAAGLFAVGVPTPEGA
ncbi:UDP-2,3-diacylglucosamine diphosphatase LpxI [Rhodoplanes sp. TEM]|uniref:UDP-2,3-diacylglucosamine diphosphatase LpxI n=1 Tax=Rhodoplanes tepidamans TaxID=200616 RepID=A0ABT5JA29_RHOTP|nr:MULTISPECIES: UDP-2,3-diacylglucosamine diphosphatase LpxI [Rhodoplanes]MDC7786413.1 UDP-2,3-diacylglucosamine diphosphatase LpxI [Rhodoplanes tepidamans]MDC7985745.1 UDP-2,3-diacylglucosamine diphosphatase LpxI [Rhodoplanes sp. TEM]